MRTLSITRRTCLGLAGLRLFAQSENTPDALLRRLKSPEGISPKAFVFLLTQSDAMICYQALMQLPSLDINTLTKKRLVLNTYLNELKRRAPALKF